MHLLNFMVDFANLFSPAINFKISATQLQGLSQKSGGRADGRGSRKNHPRLGRQRLEGGGKWGMREPDALHSQRGHLSPPLANLRRVHWYMLLNCKYKLKNQNSFTKIKLFNFI
jgi:hypothetical protein